MRQLRAEVRKMVLQDVSDEVDFANRLEPYLVESEVRDEVWKQINPVSDLAWDEIKERQ